MKKRILSLAMVLALVAVLVVPTAVFAGDVTVTGEVPAIPTVTSVTVPNAFVNTTTTVTIAGTNFVDGQTTVSLTGDAGISAGSVTFGTSTSITCPLTIAGTAVAGARNVYVTVYGNISLETVTFTAVDYQTLTVPGPFSIPATPPLIRTQANDSTAQTLSAAASLDTLVTAKVDVKGSNVGFLKVGAVSLSTPLKLSGTGFTEVATLSGTDQPLVVVAGGQAALTLATGVRSWTKTGALIVTQPIFTQVVAGDYTCIITFTATFE